MSAPKDYHLTGLRSVDCAGWSGNPWLGAVLWLFTAMVVDNRFSSLRSWQRL